MNKEIAERWCTALESGDYPQTIGALYRLVPASVVPDGFCCLGVLTDLYIKEHGLEWEIRPHPFKHCAIFKGQYACLSAEVRLWSGVQSTNGDFSGQMTLGTLNDSGSSFKEIAQVIRKYVDVL